MIGPGAHDDRAFGILEAHDPSRAGSEQPAGFARDELVEGLCRAPANDGGGHAAKRALLCGELLGAPTQVSHQPLSGQRRTTKSQVGGSRNRELGQEVLVQRFRVIEQDRRMCQHATAQVRDGNPGPVEVRRGDHDDKQVDPCWRPTTARLGPLVMGPSSWDKPSSLCRRVEQSA